MLIWLEFKDSEKLDYVGNQPLWHNAIVQYKTKFLFYRNWLESGYMCGFDLFIDDCLVSPDHIMTFIGPDQRLPLQYYALFNTLPTAWRDPSIIDNLDTAELTFRDQRQSYLTAKDIGVSLVKGRTSMPCCVNFWGRKFPNITINRRHFHAGVFSCHRNRLRVPNWKTKHNPTNILLYSMAISGASNCHCGEIHDDVIKWKHFPRYWPFVREIHRSPVNFPYKGQWRGALMFTLICARMNGWVNNREAGDLRRYRVHYDVIVMILNISFVDVPESNHYGTMWKTQLDTT